MRPVLNQVQMLMQDLEVVDALMARMDEGAIGPAQALSAI